MKRLCALGLALGLGTWPLLASDDYLAPELRAEVEALKADWRRTPSGPANAYQRARTLFKWVNAYSLAERYVPVNATQAASGVLAYPANGGRIARLDPTIREMVLLDEQPDAIGSLVADVGPFEARTHVTIRQTYTVGSKDIEPGGGLVVTSHFMTGIAYQTDDPAGDDYVTIASSNPTVRFSKSTTPMGGMHGGFRRPTDTLVFRVTSGHLTAGDTVTVTYGDASGGGRGLLLPSFSSDRMPLPLYVDFDGSHEPVSLPIQPIVVVGGKVAGVHGFAPSVAAVGEAFTVAARAEDRFGNRAVGPMPAWEVLVNGNVFAEIPAGGEAIALLHDVSFDSPGVYRFAFRAKDGSANGVANPVLVETAPERRIYWGDTHGHSGFAEGVGTPERFMIWARDDARLDFVTHSEHDIWMDDFEWNVLRENVRRFSQSPRLPRSPAHAEDRGFVAFLGYEWTIQNTQGGHHNVLFRTPDGRKRIPAQEYATLSALYRGLRDHHNPGDVVVIPHAHQAGDYRQSDPQLQPLVEVMSQHGSFEWFGRMYLRQGHQVGFTAASDNHLSQPGYAAPQGGSLSQRGGLGALRAESGDRDALFDAMKNLAAYATTGDRIILDMTVNGTPMGTRAPFAEQRALAGRVIGTAPIHTVAVVKNDAVIWEQDYLTETAGRGEDVEVLLTFSSPSEPFHRGDNPRGWRTWRGDISIEGATATSAQGMNFHDARTQSVDVTDGASVAFGTFTRGGSSSIKLALANVRRGATLTVNLAEGREFGGGPPRYRWHRTVPGSETVLVLRELEDGPLRVELPFDGYTDAIALRRIAAEGQTDVSFTVEDAGAVQGDYYYVRVTQANDAIAWSSPVWVGGHRPR